MTHGHAQAVFTHELSAPSAVRTLYFNSEKFAIFKLLAILLVAHTGIWLFRFGVLSYLYFHKLDFFSYILVALNNSRSV